MNWMLARKAEQEEIHKLFPLRGRFAKSILFSSRRTAFLREYWTRSHPSVGSEFKLRTLALSVSFKNS